MVEYEAKDNMRIVEKAKIYGKNSGKPLTKYQIAINEAAMDIAKEDPVVVLDRGLSKFLRGVFLNSNSNLVAFIEHLSFISRCYWDLNFANCYSRHSLRQVHFHSTLKLGKGKYTDQLKMKPLQNVTIQNYRCLCAYYL